MHPSFSSSEVECAVGHDSAGIGQSNFIDDEDFNLMPALESRACAGFEAAFDEDEVESVARHFSDMD